MSNEPSIIDLDDTTIPEMTAEEQKAFAEKIIAYIERNDEPRQIIITIPENAPLSITEEQRLEIIMHGLKDSIYELLRREISDNKAATSQIQP